MIERRLFLRGLASLPLIGGSVALIGAPTASAVAATPELMTRYVAWLAREHRQALVERSRLIFPEQVARLPHLFTWDEVPVGWMPNDPAAHAAVTGSPAATRAAVILSAAGVSLTGGQARG